MHPRRLFHQAAELVEATLHDRTRKPAIGRHAGFRRFRTDRGIPRKKRRSGTGPEAED